MERCQYVDALSPDDPPDPVVEETLREALSRQAEAPDSLASRGNPPNRRQEPCWTLPRSRCRSRSSPQRSQDSGSGLRPGLKRPPRTWTTTSRKHPRPP